MNLLIYITNYFKWHYTQAITDIYIIWKDIIWFFYNYFSIPLLFSTIFSPWKRLGGERKGFFDFTFIVTDILMRIFGALVRTVTIVIGLVFVLIVILLGPVFLFAWIILPLVIPLLFSQGINLLTK